MQETNHSVANALQKINNDIERFCQRYQRDPSEVTLLAVSKTKPAEMVTDAIAAGQYAFGENYIDDALTKIEAIQDPACEWHFIGAIQSNKTKHIAAHFQWAHCIDRIKIARRLSEQRAATLPPLNICLQINIDNDPNKAGIRVEEADALAKEVAQLPNITLRGLMCIPAVTDDHQQQRRSFTRMKSLLNQLQITYPSMDTLSMGMSGDLEAAIAEGATIVRIGTAIFGKR